MKATLQNGFFGGVLGALILAFAMAILQAFEAINTPVFIATYHSLFGHSEPKLELAISLFFFIIAGGLWGMLFAALVPNPTAWKGIVFGLLPMMVEGLILDTFNGEGPFEGGRERGIWIPLVANCLIWGTVTGAYCFTRVSQRKLPLTRGLEVR